MEVDNESHGVYETGSMSCISPFAFSIQAIHYINVIIDLSHDITCVAGAGSNG